MSATRLHKLTVLFLTLLYGLVGVMGEVLHDLVTDPEVLWVVSQPSERAGYYHWHGPDFHGHFHRQASRSVHRHDVRHHHHIAEEAGGAGDEEQPTAVIAWQERIHQPHSCPILSLVSTLAIGYGGERAAALILDLLITPSSEDGIVSAFELAFSSYARGPPSCPLV